MRRALSLLEHFWNSIIGYIASTWKSKHTLITTPIPCHRNKQLTIKQLQTSSFWKNVRSRTGMFESGRTYQKASIKSRKYYSLRNAFTGFNMAAFTACPPTVKKAIKTASSPVTTNIHHCI